jgi:hypothetical protein
MSGYTSALNREDDSEFKQWFGASRQELIQEFEELFIRDINNRMYLTRLNGNLLQKTVGAGITNPISKKDNTFTIDLDAGIKNQKGIPISDEMGNKIRLGDPIKVIVSGVDLEKKQIDFTLF